MTLPGEPQPLTEEQLSVLRRFAELDADLETLLRALAGAFDIYFAPDVLYRTATNHFRIPDPGIPITRAHIENALSLKREGRVSERDLVHWATVILMNDAYEIDTTDQDLIAEWLNDISFHLGAS